MTGATLTILGSGSILPSRERSPAGYALRSAEGEVTWLDAGPGSLARFGAMGGRVEEIRRVCLTHFHPDHCLDVASLLFARRNPALGELGPLEIVGPRGTAVLLRNLQGVWGGWVRDDHSTVREIDPGEDLALGSMSLHALATHHTDHSLCFRFTLAHGYVLCYSGDSDLVPELVCNATGADLFLVECSFPDEAHCPGHLTPSRIVSAVDEARPGTVVLTHFYPQMDPGRAVAQVASACPQTRVLAATDGLELPLVPEATRCS